ncbi:putative selenium-dependent hydroxylase accessory protein YqeC [Crassaminicella thermophila]|uniref:Putative selenium-dependent hydroxylase accessory protein YqeC n=1 Tax=Crassaminicella thermophila TaxID=2599308 RepID=A0A5C0SHA4_CRATE|nr:selenium cofactor biosynthesis protein YqeC [Crassaminicella thermophila]QEK13057.1 putative selenium-dependent hydroxylase accessory protein YqeC [Crassaminicella thermophila]
MKLYKALDIKNREMIALVGGGGKTTAMYALAKDLKRNKKVLISTTTAIYLPKKDQANYLIIGKDIKKIGFYLKENKVVGLGNNITVEGKLKGVDPKLLDYIFLKDYFDYIIVEADGAKHKSLKAPEHYEPVIPYESSMVLIVVGIDACGKFLNEENVHRQQIISYITKMQVGKKITPKMIAKVITSESGLLKGIPNHSRVFLIINKVDSKKCYADAYETAKFVREMDKGRIKNILLCNMLDNNVLNIL